MDWSDISPHERAKIICRQREITMEELAKMVDCSRFTLNHVLAGRQRGSMWLWRSIAERLGVRFGWLVEGEGEVWATKKVREPDSLPHLDPPPSVVADDDPYRQPTAPILPVSGADAGQRKKRG